MLKQMGGGNVGHIKGRVLAHEDDVDVGLEINPGPLSHGEVISLLPAQL